MLFPILSLLLASTATLARPLSSHDTSLSLVGCSIEAPTAPLQTLYRGNDVDCANACHGEKYAYFSRGTCLCHDEAPDDTQLIPATAGSCAPNTYTVNRLSLKKRDSTTSRSTIPRHYKPQVSQSVSAKKRAMEARARAEAANAPLCPRGSKACYVSQARTDYECVDTTFGDTTCGGCKFGEFNTGITGGVDCTTLEGVLPNRVTCNNSVCEASSCKPGFKLSNGQCVRR